MAQPTVTIRTNSRLHRMVLLTKGQSDATDDLFEAISKIYAAFIRRRFAKASRGDGTWPPLAPSTIRRRRKGKGKGSPAILRDTGLLFQQLSPQFLKTNKIPGASRSSFAAVVSFGGEGQYPDGVLVSDVMSFHQTGGGNLPRRQILVPPDAATRDKMEKAAKQVVVRYLNDG